MVPSWHMDAGLLQDAAEEDFDVFLAPTSERLAHDRLQFTSKSAHIRRSFIVIVRCRCVSMFMNIVVGFSNIHV